MSNFIIKDEESHYFVGAFISDEICSFTLISGVGCLKRRISKKYQTKL
jgi:hypothetical protein